MSEEHIDYLKIIRQLAAQNSQNSNAVPAVAFPNPPPYGPGPFNNHQQQPMNIYGNGNVKGKVWEGYGGKERGNTGNTNIPYKSNSNYYVDYKRMEAAISKMEHLVPILESFTTKLFQCLELASGVAIQTKTLKEQLDSSQQQLKTQAQDIEQLKAQIKELKEKK